MYKPDLSLIYYQDLAYKENIQHLTRNLSIITFPDILL